MEAASFFSQLTGVPENRVEQVSPETGEMIEEGREYLVALRGDPASGASLLSTTIQIAMLWRRVLDLASQAIVGNDNQNPGIFGRKAFIFTDDLDVTNRLFFNLLDAEGLDYLGRPDFSRLLAVPSLICEPELYRNAISGGSTDNGGDFARKLDIHYRWVKLCASGA